MLTVCQYASRLLARSSIRDTSSMEILDIASDGDIIMIVGSEPAPVARLRVHSLFLKAVSKVFGAMLGPHFREGIAASGTQPKRVLLPEDDAEAMIVLFQIIHHKYHDMPDCLNPQLVLEAARAADKYDCLAILKHAKTRWLDPCYNFSVVPGVQGKSPMSDIPANLASVPYGSKNLGCLMAVAFLLDDAGAFQELTSILILHYANSYLPLADEKWGGSLIPSDVLYMLEEKRTLVRTEIVQTFSAPHVLGTFGETDLPEVTNLLREAHLTPLLVLKSSIMEVVATLGEIYASPDSPGQTAYYTSNGDYVESYDHECLPHAYNRLKQITSNAYLCLDCVLCSDGNESTNCRIQHQERIPDR